MHLNVALLKHGLSVLTSRPATHLWLQGCPHSCPGCCNESFRPESGGRRRSVPDLAEEILRHRPEVLVLSGGEPFAQAAGLAALCRILDAEDEAPAVVAYSGFTLEELRRRPEAGALLDSLDVLIDGPFIAGRLADDGVRGSVNQRVIALSGTLDPRCLGRPPHLRFEFVAEAGGLLLVGIPPRDIAVLRSEVQGLLQA